MSNQGYYGYTNSYNGPQQPQYAQQPTYAQQPSYNQGQGGYPQTYQQQGYDNRGYYAGQGQPEMAPGPDGERGLGATLVGGGTAGWAARKSGTGMLGTLASAAAGAIGANLLENKLKKHSKKHNKH